MNITVDKTMLPAIVANAAIGLGVLAFTLYAKKVEREINEAHVKLHKDMADINARTFKLFADAAKK